MIKLEIQYSYVTQANITGKHYNNTIIEIQSKTVTTNNGTHPK